MNELFSSLNAGADQTTPAANVAMRKASVDRPVVQISANGRKVRRDRLAGEEPLEIRVIGPSAEAVSVGITMRTPGHDFALAVGFLFTEGILRSSNDFKRVEYCTRGVGLEQKYNIVTVHTTRPIPDGVSRRALLTSASCGICGTATLDDLQAWIPPTLSGSELGTVEIPTELVVDLPGRLRAKQVIFERTGGLHGVGLFDQLGNPLIVREDIGRHNAVDKVVGEAMLGKVISLRSCVLVVSGRVSFEIVQKAAMVGVQVLVAVSAPSSLAVDAAERFGITLVGFVRDGRANVYSHAHRVT